MFALQCQTPPAGNTQTNANTGSVPATAGSPSGSPDMMAKKIGEIETGSRENGDLKYTVSIKFQKKGTYENINYPNDNLVIEYTLENAGKYDYLVYNQGHSDQDSRSIVYAEVLSEETLELSQKQFVEPKDKQCPDRFAPVISRAAWLRKGERVSEKVYVEFPVKHNTPFDDCGPIPAMPEKLEKVKFCIGYAPADPQKTTIDNNGFVVTTAVEAVSEQKFICGGVFSLHYRPEIQLYF